MIKRFFTISFLTTLGLFFCVNLSAQNFTCNDQINVTVNHDCAIDLSVDAFIEGDTDITEDIEDGLYSYEIYNSSGVIVAGGINGPTMGGDDLSGYVNSLLFFRVKYVGSGVVCGGVVLLEDKNPPTIDCLICPVVNGDSADDYAPECIMNCYEQPVLQLRYDDRLRDDIVQEDFEDFADDTMTDNCNNWDLSTVSHYDDWRSLGVCEGTVLTRTWSVSWNKYDGNVGTVSCTREYFFRPFDLETVKEYPEDGFGNTLVEPIMDTVILPVSNIVVPCGSDISPAGIAAYFDNPLTIDRDSDDNGVDPDELDIDLVIENNEGVPYAYPHWYQAGVGSGGPHAQPLDQDICNLITGYTDSEIEACGPGCGGNIKILRNWTILDWCTGEFIIYGQIIKAADTTPPTIDVPAIVVSVDPWNCDANIDLPSPEHIRDNCDANPKYRIGNTGGLNVAGDYVNGFILVDADLGTHSIEYITEDCCGNIGSTYVNVTVVDNTPPVAVSKEFVVIGLTNISNPIDQLQGTAKVYAYDLDNGSYDGCTNITMDIRRDDNCRAADAEWGEFVTFCCEDLAGVASAEIDVELRIRDTNGNENRVWSTILLEDKSGSFPVIPPHMFLTCDMDYNDFNMTGGLPKFFGACGEATVDCDTLEVIESTEPRELRLSDGVIINGVPQEAPAYNPSCGYGAIRRQFKNCGGGEQWFVILPLNPFDDSSITFPRDVAVDCDDYDVGSPTWLEATCNLVGISLDSDTFSFEDGACMKILNRWSVINWCEYDPAVPNSPGLYEWTQVVKIVDSEDPELTVQDSLCFGVIDGCTSSGIELTGSAFDNGICGSEWLSFEVSIDAYADWTEDYNYSSTNPRLNPNGSRNPFHLPKAANGEEITITLPDGIPGSKIWHRSVWRAFDGCGNTVSATRYFQITDKKPPTPYCLNLSTAVMENGEVELWAIDFNVGSFDNCSNPEDLLFTFTDVAPPARKDEEYDSNNDLMWYNGTFWYYNSEEIDLATGAGEYEKQDSYGGEVHRWEPALRSAGKIFTTSDADATGMVQVPIYVWDGCANIDFCLINLRLVDNGGGGQAMVSGQMKTELGESIENVMTSLSGPVNFSSQVLTNANGEYAFQDTPFDADYKISGSKNDDFLNGVSTLDLVLMQRHILGQKMLDSPYKMIAADVNNDNSISAVDLLDVRKLILGVYSEFPNNTSWKFIDEALVLDINLPWNYNESILINDLNQDMIGEDFIGVKIGDVNCSAVANAVSGIIDSRSIKTIALSFDDKSVNKGETFDLKLNLNDENVFGYQMTLNISGLSLISIDGQNIGDSNVAITDGKIAISANDINGFTTSENLLNLTLESQVDASLSDIISVSSDIVQSEIYQGKDLEIFNISLNNIVTESIFALYQNEPNPFSEFTVISFDLPERSSGSLTVFDVTGKVLKVVDGDFVEGRNTVLLSSDDFGNAGMVYYKLEAGENSAVRHMVLVK
ncbi:MAG: hypothetical protein HKN51_02685 [Saprospiraceae bacterium]|nr:hypothetical protein [Saprospiraceae bacterium]